MAMTSTMARMMARMMAVTMVRMMARMMAVTMARMVPLVGGFYSSLSLCSGKLVLLDSLLTQKVA